MATSKKAEGGKPLAYSFYVDIPGGVLISSIDLFFRSKSESREIDVQIREMDSGQPSKTILPYAEHVLEPGGINVSEDATAETRVEFPNPVYLEEDTEYAVCLVAEGNSKEYEVWVSELGEFDVQTENRITEKPTSGVVFISANNRTWTQYQQLDLTCRINRAVFNPEDEMSASFVNDDVDLFTLNINTMEGSIENGETIYGNQHLTLDSTGNTLDLNVDDVITTSGGVTFTVREIDSLELQVELDDVTIPVETDDTFDDNSSNTWTVGSQTLAQGVVEQFVLRKNKLILNESNGMFRAGMPLKSTERAMDITIDSIDNYIANDVLPQVAEIELADTNINWTVEAFDGLDTNQYNVNEGKRKELPREHIIKSRSNEVLEDGGTKSLRMTVTGTTQVDNLSPIIDFDKVSVQTYHYRINNEDLSEEITTNSGDNKARYFTQTIDLDQDSEDLRLFVDAAVDQGGSIGVFAKFRNPTDDREMENIDWIELGVIEYNANEYEEQEFRIPDDHLNADNEILEYTENGVTYTGFDSFQIKFVLRASNTSKYPKLKSMRAIALIA